MDQVAGVILRGLEHGKRIVFVPKIGFLFASPEFLAPGVMGWHPRGKF
jgi:hypothetical protein